MSTLSQQYWGSFLVLASFCALTFCIQNDKEAKKVNTARTEKFKDFQKNYMIVFLLAMISDWLQGPYVYQLYVSYGFQPHEIGLLFVGGFGSSLVFGTFIGSLADKYGRKKTCLIYSICYVLACCTKTVNDFWVLMVGRILCGISTSLLFSTFESWMVCEHGRRGFDPALLTETFSYATFGNGVVAVLAGLVANFAAASFGYLAPFILAIAPLSMCFYLVHTSWPENYGDASPDGLSGLQAGFNVIRNDYKVAALGLGQSCFEGAMYIFVFLWTPALKTSEEEAAEKSGEALEESTSQFLGLIFAVFMVCMMAGSSLYRVGSELYGQRAVRFAPLVMHVTALFAIGATYWFYDNKTVVYLSFLTFEVCCGVFFPAYGVIKSAEIPENVRSSVMNIFRIPVNLVVVVVLMQKDTQPHQIFGFCAFAHSLGLVCYLYYYLAVGGTGKEYKVLETREPNDSKL